MQLRSGAWPQRAGCLLALFVTSFASGVQAFVIQFNFTSPVELSPGFEAGSYDHSKSFIIKGLADCCHQCSWELENCKSIQYVFDNGTCKLHGPTLLTQNRNLWKNGIWAVMKGFGTPGIVSLHRPATLSTTDQELLTDPQSSCCGPAYAFDGDIRTYARTDNYTYQWIAVDLGGQHDITEIVVTARCQRYGYRAHDYDLHVGSSPTPVSGFFDGSLCGRFTGNMLDCQNVTFTCPASTIGQYVSLQVRTTGSDGDNYLNVAEMTVYGVLL